MLYWCCWNQWILLLNEKHIIKYSLLDTSKLDSTCIWLCIYFFILCVKSEKSLSGWDLLNRFKDVQASSDHRFTMGQIQMCSSAEKGFRSVNYSSWSSTLWGKSPKSQSNIINKTIIKLITIKNRCFPFTTQDRYSSASVIFSTVEHQLLQDFWVADVRDCWWCCWQIPLILILLDLDLDFIVPKGDLFSQPVRQRNIQIWTQQNTDKDNTYNVHIYSKKQ